MPRDLLVQIEHNPSADYTQLPRFADPGNPGDAGRPAPPPLDLSVTLRRPRGTDLLLITAYRPAERTPTTRTNHAYLAISAPELLARAARLRTLWRDRLVQYAPVDADGLPLDHPFLSSVDVSGLAATTDHRVAELADEGRYLMDRMLAGPDPDLTAFRSYLTRALTEHGPLRVSFDSDLHLPWPMLAVAGGSADPWDGFLGYRHQIEQTGARYTTIQPHLPARTRPVASLNTDDTLDLVGRASEVRKLLEERSELSVRTESGDLLAALSSAVLDEDVMYFWCHGQFVDNGTAFEQLAVRLSDDRPIDADLVRRHRAPLVGAPDALFRPFVLLNACHTGQSAAAELEHLGRALIELGAEGVLGPQIEIPQVFAAEYAFAFLELYLTGKLTAGEITRRLVHRFAREFHNPLALTYSLHCGIDSMLSILELTP